MRLFNTIGNKELAKLITGARYRVIYIAPGMTRDVARTIEKAASEIGRDKIEIILDASADVCRLGYGEIEAIEVLLSGKIGIRKCEGIHIGVIICDNTTYIYTPIPLLIEAEPENGQINAVEIDEKQTEALIQSFSLKASHFSNYKQEIQVSLLDGRLKNTSVELGSQDVDINELSIVKKELDKCPPQKFDLARRTTVYKNYIQFVELKSIGCNIGRHTISIPSKLVNLTKDAREKDRLKATYKLMGENSKVTSKKIEDGVSQLRKTYIKSLGSRYGSVILLQKKEMFLKEVKELEKELIRFKDTSKKKLDEEIEKSKQELISILAPSVVRNPPKELVAGILEKKPSVRQAKEYLKKELDEIIPNGEEFLGGMAIQCDFKDITYEMIKDNDFIQLLKQVYQFIEWEELCKEYRVVTS